MVGCTQTHSGQVLSLSSLGSFNPDQLSSEAGGLYGTSGSSSYGVNRISNGVCPNLGLSRQNPVFIAVHAGRRRFAGLLSLFPGLCGEIGFARDLHADHVTEIQEDPGVIRPSSQTARS